MRSSLGIRPRSRRYLLLPGAFIQVIYSIKLIDERVFDSLGWCQTHGLAQITPQSYSLAFFRANTYGPNRAGSFLAWEVMLSVIGLQINEMNACGIMNRCKSVHYIAKQTVFKRKTPHFQVSASCHS